MSHMTKSTSIQFLFPKSRQFPFDEVCELIVRALHARHWKVPDFKIDLRSYGSGAQKLQYAAVVTSDVHDIELHFGRPQGHLPGGAWNDVAAVDSMRIPRQFLRVYGDESGPRFQIYIGDNWARDRTSFPGGIDAKRHGLPRTHLAFTGDRNYGGSRATRLLPINDPREYAPEGDEPRSFDTRQVMLSFRDYLQGILKIIEECPASIGVDSPAESPHVPFPPGHGPLFTYGSGQDKQRIAKGKACPEDLLPADRYGMSGQGRRLAPAYIKGGDDLPEVAYDGFLWCARTPQIPDGCFVFSSSANQLIQVTPTDARGIYVADHALYEKSRAARAAEISGKRDHFTNEEVNAFLRARACTIVPLTEYAGNYENPIYLINRELDFNEVEVICEREP